MKANKLLVAILIVATFVSVSFGCSSIAFAQTDAWTIGEMGSYTVGDQFTIPTASVSVGGTKVTASGILVYPDGSATTNQTVTLSDFGRYTISYTAQHQGKVYSKDVTLDVAGKSATVSAAKSSVSYGKYALAEKESGLMVRLAEGDVLKFTQAIDVSNVTSDDSLVRAFATPDVEGTKDFKKIYFTFTDSENPDIYLTISACHFWDNDQAAASYILAGGQNQPMTGWEEEFGKLHIDNSWGTGVRHSFTLWLGLWGVPEGTPPDSMQLDLRYDAAENSCYALSEGLHKKFIADFDSSEYFTTFWNGFPSGKVFLSVKGAIYSGQTANFCVTHVKDVDLTNDVFIDSEGPAIAVDYNGTQMPEAKVGTAYPIPDATAYDIYSGNVDVATSVWYNYSASNAVLAQVKDGAFVPDKEGTYVIEYVATDRSGNTSKKLLSVQAKNQVATPNITFNATAPTSALVGETIYPLDYTATSSANQASVSVTATFGGKTYNLDKNGLRLTTVGECEVAYTITDYIGQTTVKSYTLSVGERSEVLFLDQPTLPMYFIEGNTYTLADLYAYDYSSGTENKVLATVNVTDANGTQTLASGASYVPEVANNGDKVTIVYSVGDYTLTKEIACTVPYVKINNRDRLAIENYIQGNGISVEKLEEYMVLTATTADANWTFANKLIARNASMVFSGVEGKSTFGSLQITFTDAADFSNKVTVTFTGKKNVINVTVAGTDVALATTFDAEEKIKISYDGEGNIIINQKEIAIAKRDDGTAFAGFSQYIYVGMNFVNAKSNAQVKLFFIDDQPMKDVVSDRIAPKIVINGSYGGRNDINTVVTIPSANSGDALSANVKFTVTVVDPTGKVVTDINGLALSEVDPSKEYSFKLDQYGQYKVTYTASEVTTQRANTARFIYAINVLDLVAPTFEFKHSVPTTISVGETIILPDFVVTDNATPSENISVIKMVISPDGTINQLDGNSNSIKTAKAGIYEIRIVAFDAAHNVQMVRYFVEVK